MARIFISNLDSSVTQDNLKGILSQVAEPTKVVLVIDQKTKLPKGFAFAEFETEEEARSVIDELNGYVLNGKPLKMSEDRSSSDSQDLESKGEGLPAVQRVVFSFTQPKKKQISIPSDREISFKDVQLLKQFISQRGKILGRKYTGLDRKTQAKIAREIKRARNFALLPEPDMKPKFQDLPKF